MALLFGTEDSNWDAIGDICEVQIRRIGIFKHTGLSEAHG